MTTGIGVELTEKALKVVVVERSGAKLKLRRALCEPLGEPPDEETPREQFISKRVSKMFAENRLSRRPVCVVLPLHKGLVKDVITPFQNIDQIARTIKFDIEEYFPAISIGEMIVDFHKLHDIGENRSRVLVCSFRKEEIRDILEKLGEAGIDPVTISADAPLLLNLLTACGIVGQQPQQKEQQTEEEIESAMPLPVDAILSVTEHSGSILVFEQQTLRRVRSFKFATAQESSSPSKMLRELGQTLPLAGAPVSTLYITGASIKEEFVSTLSERLNIRCCQVELSSAFAEELTDEQRESLQLAGASCLGAAIKATGLDIDKLDFRKDEFAYRKRFEKVKKGVACTVTLLFVVMFLISYSLNMKLSAQQKQLNIFRNNAAQTYRTLLRGEKLPQGRVDEVLEQFEKVLESRREGRLSANIPAMISVLETLREFADAIQSASTRFKLSSVSITQGRVKVEGVVQAGIEAYNIRDALNRSSKRVISDVGVSKVTSKGGEGYSAEFTISYRK